jgi:hypothetical protein
VVESAEDNLGMVTAITLIRIYDVLLGIYSNINPEEADNLVKLHEAGAFASPDVAWMEPEDES